MVGLADGGDLLEVMFAVDQVKFSPLGDGERTENCVGCALALWAEEGFGFGEEKIELGEMFARGFGEVLA
jgi:hypothetical protein